MSFLSFQYVVFFLGIYLMNWIYIILNHRFKHKSYRTYSMILLLESYAFIMLADLKTAVCLFVLTVLVYLVSKGMKKYQNRKNVFKWIFAIGVVFSAGQLIIYKYCDFLMQNISRILDLPYKNNWNLFIPLGISFFTFSAIGYLTDLYRGEYEAFENFDDLALYLAFFPKFTSGPIVPANKFVHQVKSGFCSVSLERLQIGVQYVVWGMFKKMVIADHLVIFVDEVFRVPEVFDSVTCLWAVLSYSLQIYFDFSGYSDMAIGFAKMLGIDIEKNFDLPYLSRNITEFWKRWHISLSAWLMKYIYIPLGGNRKGKIRTYMNLVLTMLIGGFWHGASWNFVIWGGIHGIALVIHKCFMKQQKNPQKTRLWSIVVTYIFVCFAWIFFRADSFSQAVSLIAQMVTVKAGVHQIYSWTFLAVLFAVFEIIYSVRISKREEKAKVEIAYPIWNLNSTKGLFMFFILVGITIILAYVGQVAFIYGKF